GSVSSWMAKGCSTPSSFSACTISSRTPRSAKVVSDAARLGVMSGVMRDARMPFGSYSICQSLRSRAHQLTVEYVADSRALRLLRRANCVHAHCLGSGGTDLPAVTWIDCSWWHAAARIRGSVARSESRCLTPRVLG